MWEREGENTVWFVRREGEHGEITNRKVFMTFYHLMIIGESW